MVNPLESWCDKEIKKGKITAENKLQILDRMSYSVKVDAAHDADFVVEAIVENFDVKKSTFQALAKVAQPHTILASNTSSISITKIAGAIPQMADRVIGMHFMNPVPVMKLVEVIPGLQTSQDTLARTLQLAAQMEKTTTQARDVPGFIANRVLLPYINEAIQALYEGVGTKEDIDTTMKLGTNVPMGPLTLADFIGLDTCLSIMKVLHNDLGDSKYRPSPLLQSYVDAGYLGKKTGRGFYTY
jgi:3-hydroxybutyryl-CoA dehydrogenase